MKVSVGVAAVALPVDVGQTPVIQNLGPGVLYVDVDAEVTADSGLRIPVDTAYEWPRDITKSIYAISDMAGTDVRILLVG